MLIYQRVENMKFCVMLFLNNFYIFYVLQIFKLKYIAISLSSLPLNSNLYIYIYIYIYIEGINNSLTLSTHIDLYDIPHIYIYMVLSKSSEADIEKRGDSRIFLMWQLTTISFILEEKLIPTFILISVQVRPLQMYRCIFTFDSRLLQIL